MWSSTDSMEMWKLGSRILPRMLSSFSSVCKKNSPINWPKRDIQLQGHTGWNKTKLVCRYEIKRIYENHPSSIYCGNVLSSVCTTMMLQESFSVLGRQSSWQDPGQEIPKTKYHQKLTHSKRILLATLCCAVLNSAALLQRCRTTPAFRDLIWSDHLCSDLIWSALINSVLISSDLIWSTLFWFDLIWSDLRSHCQHHVCLHQGGRSKWSSHWG